MSERDELMTELVERYPHLDAEWTSVDLALLMWVVRPWYVRLLYWALS